MQEATNHPTNFTMYVLYNNLELNSKTKIIYLAYNICQEQIELVEHLAKGALQ